jgi:hypothetical protein
MSQSGYSTAFMELDDSMPPSQVPATDLYLEPDKSSNIPQFYLFKIHLMLPLLPLTVSNFTLSALALYPNILLHLIIIIIK